MSAETATRTGPWNRTEAAQKQAVYEQNYARLPSQRQAAKDAHIPRSTVQYWLAREKRLAIDPALSAFFESPAGVAFLQRLVVAAHLVMTLQGPCGIRLVGQLLELAGLAPFVATSYSAQQRVAVAMEKAVVEFGQVEKQRLATDMRSKTITVCQDETFHPEVCLVAIEPVSNFILVETYAENRTAAQWTKVMREATAGLAVTIAQATSDEGTGIVHHVVDDLNGHHSPDTFHVQNELVTGPGCALTAQKRQAERHLTALQAHITELNEKKAVASQANCAMDRLDQQIQHAQQQETAARQTLEVTTARASQAQQAIQAISAAYHPYDLTTGTAKSVTDVAAELDQSFTHLEQLAMEAHLSERCFNKIHKAQRVVTDMLATIAFFFLLVRTHVEALGLPPDIEQAMSTQLIPAIYLDLVANKTADAEQRAALRFTSDQLLAPLHAPDSPLHQLTPEEQRVVELTACDCAHFFQRSSSCVEGRNGQLALWHHGLHRLRERKLAALTTVHNYFIKRPDGTTAAERFFEAKPRDLFQWLLDRVELPGRSAHKRACPQQKSYLPGAT